MPLEDEAREAEASRRERERTRRGVEREAARVQAAEDKHRRQAEREAARLAAARDRAARAGLTGPTTCPPGSGPCGARLRPRAAARGRA